MFGRCKIFSSRDSVMQMITMARQALACGNNWGGPWQRRREASQLPSCYVVPHMSPNRGLLIVGCLAKLALDKPSADHPDIRLGAAVTEAGALSARWLIEEQPDGCRSCDCDDGACSEGLKCHHLASALASASRLRSVNIVIMRSRSQRVSRSVRYFSTASVTAP